MVVDVWWLVVGDVEEIVSGDAEVLLWEKDSKELGCYRLIGGAFLQSERLR